MPRSDDIEELVRIKRRLQEMGSGDPPMSFREENALWGASILIDVVLQDIDLKGIEGV